MPKFDKLPSAKRGAQEREQREEYAREFTTPEKERRGFGGTPAIQYKKKLEELTLERDPEKQEQLRREIETLKEALGL